MGNIKLKPSSHSAHPGLRAHMKKILPRLQSEVGKSPVIKIESLENWSSTQKRELLFTVAPENLEQIQQVIKAAAKFELKVRATGSKHSWSPLYPDEGHICILTNNLKDSEHNQIRLHQGAKPSATVMANVTTGEFRDFCLDNGVTLPCNVILTEVTYGGTVATSSHGAGWNLQTISDQVESLRLVDSSGELRTFSSDDQDGLRAVQCNLGMCGIVYDMRLRLEPMKIGESRNMYFKLGEIFGEDMNKLKEIVENNYSTQIYWFPFNSVSVKEGISTFLKGDLENWDPRNDEILVKVVNIPSDPGNVVHDEYYEPLNIRSYIQNRELNLLDDLELLLPRVTPSFLHVAWKEFRDSWPEDKVLYQQLPNAIHYRPQLHTVPPILDMEFAFDLDKDFATIFNAVNSVTCTVESYASEGKFPLNNVMEMRFMGSSEAYLSPAYSSNTDNGGSGHTVYLEVISAVGTAHWNEFCTDLFNQWKSLPDMPKKPLPHWGKQWSFLPEIEHYYRETLGESMEKFIQAYHRLNLDPHGMFLNESLSKIFFPEKIEPKPKKRSFKRMISRKSSKKSDKPAAEPSESGVNDKASENGPTTPC